MLGPTYDMTWDALRAGRAARSTRRSCRWRFLLVLVGYGTKVGLAPMHTWLPDAHSESPAPVSAMLSGALLNTAMLGIVRYLAVADAAPGSRAFCRGWRWWCSAHLSLADRRAVHRAPAGHQAADGLFQRRAYGRHRARLRLWRAARHRRRALSHAEPFAEQIADVLWRGQCDARLRHQGDQPASGASAAAFRCSAALWLAGAVAITGAPPFGSVSQRADDHAGRACSARLSWAVSDGGAADRHLHRVS